MLYGRYYLYAAHSERVPGTNKLTASVTGILDELQKMTVKEKSVKKGQTTIKRWKSPKARLKQDIFILPHPSVGLRKGRIGRSSKGSSATKRSYMTPFRRKNQKKYVIILPVWETWNYVQRLSGVTGVLKMNSTGIWIIISTKMTIQRPTNMPSTTLAY